MPTFEIAFLHAGRSSMSLGRLTVGFRVRRDGKYFQYFQGVTVVLDDSVTRDLKVRVIALALDAVSDVVRGGVTPLEQPDSAINVDVDANGTPDAATLAEVEAALRAVDLNDSYLFNPPLLRTFES
jgi:hypothetical protein